MQEIIENKLKNYIDPYLEKDLVAAHAVKEIVVSETEVKIVIELGYPCASIQPLMVAELKKLLQPVVGARALNIEISTCITPHVGHQGLPGLKHIKNIIAVASGKGGVGKSTVTVNLALALAKEGASVGILDADVYGPSQPHMLNTHGQRPVVENQQLEPIRQHGVQAMSIGYLVEADAAMIWRGPMIGKALQQLMYDTKWQDLDYLVIDLPPGTGDIQLTLCQKVPMAGAVIVTTPQDMALHDVKRACEAFNKLNVPILGVVENMSFHQCSQCGKQEHIFGEAGGQQLAQAYQIPFLGSIPLHKEIREKTDAGQPPVVSEPESEYASRFYDIARKVAGKLAGQKKDYSAMFGKIKIQNSQSG